LSFGDQPNLDGCKRSRDLRIFFSPTPCMHGPKTTPCRQQRRGQCDEGASR
jgi:hypothetical protein